MVTYDKSKNQSYNSLIASKNVKNLKNVNFQPKNYRSRQDIYWYI